ncbi:hypothetical protein O9H85_28560 [Paenibacillus filicis]|uniref:Lipoprotein n=1 Tax=Paenibacillus gyeongsangnamensis TaxID=3388067 RepID=A0ABT4QHR3_9BACL|nr:hypothetical protein [Paenibacillus filicis]MCZ8516276.1 hypothetical protein [Paenibacillus filicis]
MRLQSVLVVLFILLIGLIQTGCSSKQSQQQPAHNHTQESGSAASPSNAQIGKAINDELTGLSSIEAAVNKGDFDSAGKLFGPLHDEYHASVLPPIQDKNAKLAEDMHTKFDSLDDAVDQKDKDKILSAIKANKDSLNQAAKELGVTIK